MATLVGQPTARATVRHPPDRGSEGAEVEIDETNTIEQPWYKLNEKDMTTTC